MKIILFILALTISQITSAENGGAYTQMNLEEVQSDPEIQDLLNFGVQYLTQEEILVQKLPDAQYTVSQIHSVWSQAVSGINYRFDVDIINNLGWVLRATFEVYSQPWTNTKEVTSYVYDVTANPNSSVNEEEFVLPNNEGDLDGAYEAVDPSEVNTNEDLQHSLDAGTQEVVNQAIIDHLLPESVYQIAQIHSIYSQAVSGTNYRFDVDLINCAGLVARTVFTVYSQSWTHTLDTTPGTLHITSIPNEGLVGGDCPSENNGSEEENTWGCEEEDNWEDDDDGSIGGGWTLMDPQDAENDQEVQDALNFGVPELVKRAIASGELPDGSYSLDAVARVEEQVVSGMNYRFDVSLSSTDGLGVRVSFEVYSQSWTSTQELTSYFIFAVGSAEEDSF